MIEAQAITLRCLFANEENEVKRDAGIGSCCYCGLNMMLKVKFFDARKD